MTIDYANSGLTIQQAIVQEAKRIGKGEGRGSVLWQGLRVQAFCWMEIPSDGEVKIELVRYKRDDWIGIDLRFEGGGVKGQHGWINRLRTWASSDFDDSVSYQYTSLGRVSVSIVSKVRFPNGRSSVESLTGNSAFYFERLGSEIVGHASHAQSVPPDFDFLEFRLKFIA